MQCLFLQRFLSYFDATTDLSWEETERRLLHNWIRAKYICEDQELRLSNAPRELAWHLTDMIELALLRTLTPELLIDADEAQVELSQRFRLAEEFSQEKVFHWLRQMDHLSHDESPDTRFAIAAGQRQLLRYRTYADMLYQPPASPATKSSGPQRYQRDFSTWGYESLGQEFKSLYEPIEAYVKGQLRDDV